MPDVPWICGVVIGTERFWAGRFGDNYRLRNQWDGLAESNKGLWGRILSKVEVCASVLELGAGSGLNVPAIRAHLPSVAYAAVEINKAACVDLAALPSVEVNRMSILDYIVREPVDLVFTKGVLIHMAPEDLPKVYDLMFRASHRYVCFVEYHNQRPVKIQDKRYRKGTLWKRDFCGEMMAQNPRLKLLDYGFLYKGDLERGQREDLHWFLMEKA